MDYFLIIILTIVIIVLIVIMVINSMRRANSNDKDVFGTVNLTPIKSEELKVKSVQEYGIIIPIERLSLTTAIDEKELFEITDNAVIARISAIIPSAAEKIAKNINTKALTNAELYKAIIPGGATLVNSKEIEGAVRGIYRGSSGIKGHANLVKIDPSKISKASTIANGVANVMNVGSLVVGQYYITEINSKLETMSKNVSKISDFLDRELISKKGIEGFFATIPGFIDNNLNYKELKNGLGQKINAQKSKNQLMLNEPEDIYGKDVQIIIKNGKYYYLHESPVI